VKPYQKGLTPETIQLLREAKAHDAKDFAVPTQRTSTGSGGDAFEEPAVDVFGSAFLAPTVEEQMNTPGSSLTGRSIIEELTEDRMNGKVAPFVSGPIGAYVRTPKKKPLTDRQVQQIHNKWREQERAIMLALRAKNDAAMVSELESL